MAAKNNNESACAHAGKSVRAIPILILKNADKALEHYKKAFGAEETHRMMCPKTGVVAHAGLKIGETEFFVTEERPEMGCTASPGQSFYLYVPDADKAFETAKKAGLKEVQPVADQFWGDRYGTLTDPFGYTWGIATHKEDLSPAEMGERAQKFFASMAQRKTA
jgi:PhnB protein